MVNWLGKVPPYDATTIVSTRKPITASSTWPGTGYEASKANDSDLMTRWGAAGDPREGALTIDLGEETGISRVWIAETDFAHTREFSIEVMQSGAWKEIARGTTIGKDKALEFPSIKSRQVRLNILKAEGPININEFQVFTLWER